MRRKTSGLKPFNQSTTDTAPMTVICNPFHQMRRKTHVDDSWFFDTHPPETLCFQAFDGHRFLFVPIRSLAKIQLGTWGPLVRIQSLRFGGFPWKSLGLRLSGISFSPERICILVRFGSWMGERHLSQAVREDHMHHNPGFPWLP